ncbi:metallopeptidase family protein [Rubrimonas cliftonensis]|uniref:Predicted Zn-dependent protease, minimal metalloprotease (MMP)-like domain n=1 Tax=Rubrimonas cliftonensis TaxID=89524 RepID=A0A1H4DB41_9RHOB|nr:metallopeptidase family protein [Rubrimonas cliftonensis]SEA69639.1 Predicted Zn-dependent protease, minimal metalloprotease (MMP)-like domain [Rubrimonas cliftonensis]
MSATESWPADAAAPSLADIDALARAAFAALPEAMRARCDRLVIGVEEFPDDALLDDMGIEDPFELTGLYEGVALTEQSVDDALRPPDRVTLYRRPILDEWADRANVSLRELVAHVLVHEVAHHVGLSDDDIAAIDDWTL